MEICLILYILKTLSLLWETQGAVIGSLTFLLAYTPTTAETLRGPTASHERHSAMAIYYSSSRKHWLFN